MNTLSTIEINETDIVLQDGVPTIRDLTLAENLGFDRPRNIRKLIERHLDTLKEMGEVCSMMEQTTEKGGRPSSSYYLNEHQAAYIATKSNTEKADQVTVAMVKVFTAYRKGELTPTGTPPIKDLEGQMAEMMHTLSQQSATNASLLMIDFLQPLLKKLETGVGSSILEITHVSKKLEGQSITERLNSMQAQIDRMESRHHGVLIQAGKIKKAVDIILGQGKDLPYVNAA